MLQRFLDTVFMKQNFKEITLHFRLRNKNDRKTLIVVVIYYDGKLYRCSSGVSVMPEHWNSKKECAVISPMLNDIQNSNNKIVNDRLTEIRNVAHDLFNDGVISIQKIKTIMGKKQTKATTLLNKAFDNLNENVAPRTYNNNMCILNTITTYIKNDDISFFTERVLFDIREQLNNTNKYTPYRINQIINYLYNLIIEIRQTVDIPEPIKPKPHKEDKKNKDEAKHFEILQDEIDAINSLDLSGVKDKARSAFNILLLCGQRHSDLPTVVNGIINEDYKDNILQITTQKCNTLAHIQVTPELIEWVTRYNSINKNLSLDTLNKYLKQIFAEAECNRIHKYGDTDYKISEIVGSHCARVTFITRMARKGYKYDDISNFSGNSVKEIQKTYEQLSKEDKRNKVSQLINKTDIYKEHFAEDILQQLYEDAKEDIYISTVDKDEINKFIKVIKKPLPKDATATEKDRFNNIRNNCFEVCRILYRSGDINASAYYIKFIKKARQLKLTDECYTTQQMDNFFECE